MIVFRKANQFDKDFILNANEEINLLSGLNDSVLEKNIDKDLFEDKCCKSLIVEINGETAGFILYSYIYWANCGKGIYVSQAYVKKDYRRQGLLNDLLTELENIEKDCNFITNLVGSENEIMSKALNRLNFKSSDLITYYRKIDKEKEA